MPVDIRTTRKEVWSFDCNKGRWSDVAVSQYLSASFIKACQITSITTLAARQLIWSQAIQLLLLLLESLFVRVLSNISVLFFMSFGLIQFVNLSWKLWLMLKIKLLFLFLRKCLLKKLVLFRIFRKFLIVADRSFVTVFSSSLPFVPILHHVSRATPLYHFLYF
jgi:hypothetical protein